MIQVLTPRWPRGCSRGVLSIVLALACPSFALAQRRGEEPPKGERDTEQAKKAAVDATKAQATDQNEQWKDPNAAAANENEFPELKAPPGQLSQAEARTV